MKKKKKHWKRRNEGGLSVPSMLNFLAASAVHKSNHFHWCSDGWLNLTEESPKSKTRCGSFENAERRVLSSVHANANALHLEKHNTVCLTAMSARIAQNSLLYLSSSNQSNEARRNLAAFACRRVVSWTSLTSAAHQKSRGEAWA